MRLVLLSDIHGNNLALQKVLEDVEEGDQSFVCLGDSIWNGPQPTEVLRELRGLNCPVVMGNTDEFLVGRAKERLHPILKDLNAWCNGRLSEDDRAFIGTFKPTITLPLGDGLELLCYHGSPRSNREGIYATTSDKKLTRILRGHPEKVLAGGHTHSQMVRRFGDRLIVNPGSVGQPFEYKGRRPAMILPQAEYAVVDNEGGKTQVSLKRVKYGIDKLEKVVESSDMPHKKLWLKEWKR